MKHIYFTSDTHFGHANIIKYCNRPFSSVDEMDDYLITKWNETIPPDGVVYHLGDFAFYRNKREVTALLSKLNGQKILVVGNHDHEATRKSPGWYAIYRTCTVGISGKSLFLAHHPKDHFLGDIHLHGHTHNTIPATPRKRDVGVDTVPGYRPLALHEVLK